MMWQGPHVKYRRPEARKYSMWIKDSKDNNFLREKGIRCLSDHEIGTHFVSLTLAMYKIKEIGNINHTCSKVQCSAVH